MHRKLTITIFVVLAIAIIGGIIAYVLLKSDEQVASFKPKVFGEGEILITFEVKVPEWTPKEDKVYVYIDGFYYGVGGGVPMEEKEPNVWAVSYKAPENQALKYKYNRNNDGFPTDEEFSPDSEKTRREINVGMEEISINDEIKNWRWLTKEPPQANLSDFKPKGLPKRSEPFVLGISTLDYYGPVFTDFVPSTFQRIKDKGVEYVGITHFPSCFTSADPLTFSNQPINTYTDEELESAISEARKAGLKIMLSLGIETDPRNQATFQKIEKSFSEKHEDEWYRKLAKEWEKSMLKTAKLAEKHEIEILALSNQWPFWGDKTESQMTILNDLINNAYSKIRKVYSGKITSDYYGGTDEYFDYYKQLDWIGDKWWWEIAGKKKTNLNEMKVASEKIINETYRPIYEKYQKPIFLHQVAYGAYDGAAGGEQINTEGEEVSEYHPYNKNYPFDFQEQVDAYEAMFQAIYDEPIFAGAFAFSYEYWNSYDKTTGIRAKPAEEVWVKWSSIFNEK